MLDIGVISFHFTAEKTEVQKSLFNSAKVAVVGSQKMSTFYFPEPVNTLSYMAEALCRCD